MNNILTYLFICFFSLNLIASPVELTKDEQNWLSVHPTIILGTDENWAPFVKNDLGVLSGYDVDILNLINKNTGANFQLTIGIWKDIVDKATTKKIDGLSTSAVHKEREEFFNFSDVYASTQKFFIILNSNSKIINSIDDLNGKKIGYLEKNLFDKKLISQYENFINVPFENIDELIQDLIAGKIDATIGNNEIFDFVEKNKLPYLKILEKIKNSKLDLVFSLRKDYPEAISILNKGLNSISEDEKDSLNKKWFSIIYANIEDKNILNLTKEEKEYLRNKKVLRVANLEAFPPFNFNENGVPKGYTVDYINLMAKYLDIEIEYVSNKPWNEYLTLLKEEKLDLIPHLAVNNERKEYVDFTNFNHIEYTTGMAVDKNSNIKSMDDLKDKIIAVANNTFLHTYLKNNFPNYSLLLTSSSAKAVEAVYLGQAHAVVGSLPALDYYIQKNWLSNIKTININDFGRPTKTALPMGILKGNNLLKSILEKANLSISHNQVANLKQKWMNITPHDMEINGLTNEELDYLEAKKEIKMCVLPDWLPFEQIDKNGQHKGISADIIKIISTYIETPIVLVPTKEWSDSLQNIRNRKCDILPAAMKTSNRLDAMNFTNPYLQEPFVVVTKLNELFIKDSQALSGKKIGIVKSYAFIDVLKQKNPSIEIVEVINTKEGLEKVSRGELFGYIDTMPTIGYGIQKYSMYDLKIAGKLEFDINLSIASRNDEEILNTIMQKALDSIKEEQKRTIIGKWIEIKVSQEFDTTLLWQISAFFLLIVLAVLYKNRAVVLLNRELIYAKQEIEEQQKMVNKYVLILSTNTEGIIIDVNEAFCKAIGYSKEELINQKYTILRQYDENDNTFNEIKKVIYSDKTWFGEIKNIKKDKEDIWFNMYIEPIIKNKIKIGYRTISENITDKKRIEELSVTDKLTGLSNRLKLDEIMIIKVEEFKRYKTPFSIMLIDIDDFKKVNDTYGHDVGDYVLKTIAKILKDNIRVTDVVGRWGGEEFIIICENTNIEQIYVLAEHIRLLIGNQSFDMVGRKTISLGIAEFEENDSINTIFKKADVALYNAKTSGKNKTSVS